MLGPHKHSGIRLTAAIGLMLLPGFAQTTPHSGTPEQLDELRIKVAFLFNFAKFTQWPEEAASPENKAFRVGVLGDDPVLETLRELTRGRTLRNLPIVIVEARKAEDLRSCQIAFIGTAERRRMPAHLRLLAGLPVLTVSSLEGFLDHGGIVELFLKENRMRFAINRTAGESSGLRMSAELQALASSR